MNDRAAPSTTGEIASRIGAAVEASSLSVAEVAAEAEMTPPELSEALTGAHSISMLTLIRLARALSVHPSSFLEGVQA